MKEPKDPQGPLGSPRRPMCPCWVKWASSSDPSRSYWYQCMALLHPNGRRCIRHGCYLPRSTALFLRIPNLRLSLHNVSFVRGADHPTLLCIVLKAAARALCFPIFCNVGLMPPHLSRIRVPCALSRSMLFGLHLIYSRVGWSFRAFSWGREAPSLSLLAALRSGLGTLVHRSCHWCAAFIFR